MSNSRHRHLRALEVLPAPVRDVLREDADLSAWPDLMIKVIKKVWGGRPHPASLDEIPAAEILMCQRFLRESVIQALEARAEDELVAVVAPVTLKLCDNPWALDHSERSQLMAAMAPYQTRWIAGLENLVEPPPIDDSFPAFLLETTPFKTLKSGIGECSHRNELETAVADQLQFFVDRYRSYMLDTDAEEITEHDSRPANTAKASPGLFS